MKQILVMLAVVVLVGCGEKDLRAPQAKNPQAPKATSAKLIADPIVEKAVREKLEKPEGELTEADLEKVIDLSFTQITDAGLKEVAKLQQLTHLLLNYTQITDAGLKDVAKLQRLEALSLFGTKVTEASEAELKGALPNLERLNGNPTK